MAKEEKGRGPMSTSLEGHSTLESSEAMPFEIIITAVVLALGLGEFFVWYSEVLWHKERKPNSRNWTPPR